MDPMTVPLLPFTEQENCRAGVYGVAPGHLREYKNWVWLSLMFIACARRHCGTDTTRNQRRCPGAGKKCVRRIYEEPRQPAQCGALLAAPAHAGDGATARGAADIHPWGSEPAGSRPWGFAETLWGPL